MKKPAAFLFVVVAAFLGTALNNDNKAFEISKNIDIFVSAYKELNSNYVDELNPDSLMRVGLNAMVRSVDPYTQFIPAEEYDNYQYGITGRYGGVGVSVQKHKDRFVIVRAYDYGPAYRAGIRPGDVLLAVDDKVFGAEDSDNATSVLKGRPGTPVALRIQRAGEKGERTVRFLREEIKVPNVPYYTLLENGTAYVALSTFTEHAGDHIAMALRELEANDRVNSIVLDLRGNTGGLLNEALQVANLFLPKNVPITHLRSRNKEWDKTYEATKSPLEGNKPLALLMDAQSASASEIVAGAIQDHDRGVVVGGSSFGKGLVQNTFDLSYNTHLRITTAKYFTPSGRCIQAARYQNGRPVAIPDSLRTAFRTANGRTVFDGGGIQPDVPVEGPAVASLVRDLEQKKWVFDFVSQYLLAHPEKPDPERFTVGDAVFEEFAAFVRKNGYVFENSTDACLRDLEAKAREEGVYAALSDELAVLRKNYEADRQNDLVRHKASILRLLGQEIIERHYPQKGKYYFGLRQDPQLAEAVRILNDPAAYRRILSGKK
jgi:carboxyl-terminal processing protease